MNISPNQINCIKQLQSHVASLTIDPAPVIRSIVDSYPAIHQKSMVRKINILTNVWLKLHETKALGSLPIDPTIMTYCIHALAEKNAADLAATHTDLNIKSVYVDLCVVQALATHTLFPAPV